MTKYVVREIVEYTTIINNEEVTFKKKVHVPVTSNSKADAIIYGLRFMEARVLEAIVGDTMSNVRDCRTKENTVSLLLKGKEPYCVNEYKTDNIGTIYEKYICKLEEV